MATLSQHGTEWIRTEKSIENLEDKTTHVFLKSYRSDGHILERTKVIKNDKIDSSTRWELVSNGQGKPFKMASAYTPQLILKGLLSKGMKEAGLIVTHFLEKEFKYPGTI